MKVRDCGNCQWCRPTPLAHEGKGFGSITLSASPSQPTFCATSTPTSGPLNICISNNCSGLEIKFELAGGTLFNLNFPRASTISGTTTTCRAAFPSPFWSTSSRATTDCRTAIPPPFGRAPCEAATFASPLGNPPATCGTTCQSQFGVTPCQTNNTPCGMGYPTGTAVTFIVGSTPCTSCSTSPLIFRVPQVGSYTETPAKISVQHVNEEPHAQSTGSKIVTYTPTVVPDGSSVVCFVYLQSISAMPAYNNKSVEELRWEDYRLGHEGDLKYGSKPTEVPSSDPSTKPSVFVPPTTSTLKFPNAPDSGFHAFDTSDNSTSLAFCTSSNPSSTKTPLSTFWPSFTSGVNSTVPLFGAPSTTDSSSFNFSGFGSMSSPMSIPSNQSCPHSFSDSITNVYGKPQDSATVAPCIFGTSPVPTFGTSNCTASTESVAASGVFSCGLPMSVLFDTPFGASTSCPFSNSTTTSVLGKPQMSGTFAPCTWIPPAPEFGNCSTSLPSSISGCGMSSNSKSKHTSISCSFDKNRLFGLAPSSAPSFGSELSDGWTPPAVCQSRPLGKTSPNLFPGLASSSHVQSSLNSLSVSWGATSTRPSADSGKDPFNSNFNVMNPVGSAQPTPSISTGFQAKPGTSVSSAQPTPSISTGFQANPGTSVSSAQPTPCISTGFQAKPGAAVSSAQPTPSISTGFQAKLVTSGASGINNASDAFSKVTLEQQ